VNPYLSLFPVSGLDRVGESLGGLPVAIGGSGGLFRRTEVDVVVAFATEALVFDKAAKVLAQALGCHGGDALRLHGIHGIRRFELPPHGVAHDLEDLLS
jgi:hypothetical protein